MSSEVDADDSICTFASNGDSIMNRCFNGGFVTGTKWRPVSDGSVSSKVDADDSIWTVASNRDSIMNRCFKR
jgi:hypothetical protein